MTELQFYGYLLALGYLTISYEDEGCLLLKAITLFYLALHSINFFLVIISALHGVNAIY